MCKACDSRRLEAGITAKGASANYQEKCKDFKEFKEIPY